MYDYGDLLSIHNWKTTDKEEEKPQAFYISIKDKKKTWIQSDHVYDVTETN